MRAAIRRSIAVLAILCISPLTHAGEAVDLPPPPPLDEGLLNTGIKKPQEQTPNPNPPANTAKPGDSTDAQLQLLLGKLTKPGAIDAPDSLEGKQLADSIGMQLFEFGHAFPRGKEPSQLFAGQIEGLQDELAALTKKPVIPLQELRQLQKRVKALHHPFLLELALKHEESVREAWGGLPKPKDQLQVNEFAALMACELHRRTQKVYVDYAKVGKEYSFARKLRGDLSLLESQDGKADLQLIPVAMASAEWDPDGIVVPWNGYCFKILEGQGPDADGGRRSYLDDNGRMTKGHALVAFPAVYGETGRKTFMTSYVGPIFQKDLGQGTRDSIRTMTEFNPDPSWSRCNKPTRKDLSDEEAKSVSSDNLGKMIFDLHYKSDQPENNGLFPANGVEVRPLWPDDLNVLINPRFPDQAAGYVYVAGSGPVDATNIVIFENVPPGQEAKGRNAAIGAGSVEFLTEAEFLEKMKATKKEIEAKGREMRLIPIKKPEFRAPF